MANANKVVPIRPSVIGHFMAGITGQAVPPAGGPPPANPPQGNANPVPPAANQQFGGGNGGGGNNPQQAPAQRINLPVLVLWVVVLIVVIVSSVLLLRMQMEINNQEHERAMKQMELAGKGVSKIPELPMTPQERMYKNSPPLFGGLFSSDASASSHSSAAAVAPSAPSNTGTEDCLEVKQISAGQSCLINTGEFDLKWTRPATWTQGADCSEFKNFDAASADKDFSPVNVNIQGSVSCVGEHKLKAKFTVQQGTLFFSKR